MSKVNEILKENQLLKKELEGILELIAENEVKAKGLKIVEYAFLLSESLEDIDAKPMVYLEEIFDIDKSALFINIDAMDLGDIDEKLTHIYPVKGKTFDYFFLEKRPYLGQSTVNMISEFNIYENIGSYIIAPIILHDKILGSLNLYSKNINRYSPDYNSDFIKDLCFKIAISLRNLNLKKMLSDQSLIDDATGCYNKKAMYSFLAQFINRCKRYNQHFTFLILDLDDFKRINDRKGHLIGDKILSRFGTDLRKSFRKSDIIGRFGGDEFYIITPETNENKIVSIINKAEKILQDIFKDMKIRAVASISFGKTVVLNLNESSENPETVFKLADAELYKMKKERHSRR